MTPFAPNDNPAGRLHEVNAQTTDAESYVASHDTEKSGLKSYPAPLLYAMVSFPFGNVAVARFAVAPAIMVCPSVNAHVPEEVGSSIKPAMEPLDAE